MSTSLLVGRGQQPSSPFGLGHKQAKKAKNMVQMRHSCTIFFLHDERSQKLDRLRLKLYTVRTVNFR